MLQGTQKANGRTPCHCAGSATQPRAQLRLIQAYSSRARAADRLVQGGKDLSAGCCRRHPTVGESTSLF